jgi:hypothetical protein
MRYYPKDEKNLSNSHRAANDHAKNLVEYPHDGQIINKLKFIITDSHTQLHHLPWVHTITHIKVLLIEHCKIKINLRKSRIMAFD